MVSREADAHPSVAASPTAVAVPPASRAFRVWMAAAGIVGVVLQVFSFSINPAPPAGLSAPELVAWGTAHANLVLAGAWCQGTSSFLIVFFVFALVYLSGEATRPLGWITLLASAVVVAVSMIECTYYIGAVEAGEAGNLAILLTNLQLIIAVQHAYVIAPATAFMGSLGTIILRSRVVPRALGALAVLIAVVLEVLGVIALFQPLQPVVDDVLASQEVVLLICAVALLLGARRRPVTAAFP